jgi:hypothetical protein
VIVIVPVYVAGTKVAALTLTLNTLPPTVPDVAERTSQVLLPVDAFHVTGREQVPVSLKVIFCVEADCPCGIENVRPAGDGGDSTHGGRSTVSVTVNDWGLPCTVAPLASLAEMVTFVG